MLHPMEALTPFSGCEVLLGVVSSLTDAGRLLRTAVRQSYAREAARAFCVRFLVGNASMLPPGKRRFVTPALEESRAAGDDLVWLDADDRNCASKTYAWFSFAARHAPASTRWIAKADDDTYVQPDALAADLAALADDSGPPHVVAGHINWASAWVPLSPGSLAGKPCGPVAPFRGLWRPRDGRSLPECGTSTRSYPFAAGPLYALSTALVRLVFRESWPVSAMARTQRWACSGEDAMLGYCISLAGALGNFTVTLAHMTWVRGRRHTIPSPRCLVKLTGIAPVPRAADQDAQLPPDTGLVRLWPARRRVGGHTPPQVPVDSSGRLGAACCEHARPAAHTTALPVRVGAVQPDGSSHHGRRHAAHQERRRACGMARFAEAMRRLGALLSATASAGRVDFRGMLGIQDAARAGQPVPVVWRLLHAESVSKREPEYVVVRSPRVETQSRRYIECPPRD